MNTQKTIGFVGTGIMGRHMARHLAGQGNRVCAWNRTPEKAERLRDFGVHIAAHPAEVAHGAEAVICMLSSDPVCNDILFDRENLVAAMTPGSTLIVMSSIAVETAREQARRAREYGVDYLDAPVSGGEKGAEAAKLVIMAGGEAEVFERSRNLFAALGRATRVGPVGSGQLAKLVNQMLVASTIAAVAEGLLFAERGGADPAMVREALLGGFADSTILRVHGERMISGNFTPGGPAKYQIKDSGNALNLARSLGLELPLLALVDRLFTDMVEHGDGDLDHSALILELKRRQGA